MPARYKVHPVFLTEYGNFFLDATRNVSIAVHFHSFLDVRHTATTTANGNALDFFGTIEELVLHAMDKSRIQAIHKFFPCCRRIPFGNHANSTHTDMHKLMNRVQAKQLCNDGVIANFTMTIERQMETEHGNSVVHKLTEAFCELANRELGLALPKTIRMMNDDAVRLFGNGGINQLVAQAHARHNPGHLVARFDTQSVYAVILEGFRIQQVVKPCVYERQIHIFSLLIKNIPAKRQNLFPAIRLRLLIHAAIPGKVLRVECANSAKNIYKSISRYS